MPQPPPGFVPLNSDAKPSPPPGFVPMTQAEPPSLLGEVGRQAGLTARALAGGAAQAVEPFTEPVRYLMNAALPGNPVGNIEAATDEALTRVGVPEPRGAVERGVQSVGRFATSAGLGAGGAKGVEKALGIVTPKQATTLTTDQLREYANAAYKAADDAGVVIHPGSFKSFVDRVAGATRQAGVDKDIHPKATAAIRRLQEAVEEGEPLKLKDMEILRRVANAAGKSIDADERRIAKIIKGQFDDYMGRLGQADVVAGDPQAASAALSTARNLWSRMSKAEVVQDAIEKAGVRAGQFTGSGFENALRTQFRQIAMNDKRMRGFSKAEQEAIKKVAMGGPIDNALRMLGKLAPTGVISGGIGAGAGYAVGGPVGAVAVPLAGTLARRGATNLTQRNVQKAGELMRRGAPAPKQMSEYMPQWVSGAVFGVDGD